MKTNLVIKILSILFLLATGWAEIGFSQQLRNLGTFKHTILHVTYVKDGSDIVVHIGYQEDNKRHTLTLTKDQYNLLRKLSSKPNRDNLGGFQFESNEPSFERALTTKLSEGAMSDDQDSNVAQ